MKKRAIALFICVSLLTGLCLSFASCQPGQTDASSGTVTDVFAATDPETPATNETEADDPPQTQPETRTEPESDTDTPDETDTDAPDETETETEAVDLSVPADALTVFGPETIGNMRRQTGLNKSVNNVNKTDGKDGDLTYVTLTAKGKDPYIYVTYQTPFECGRYIRLCYRTTDAGGAQIYIGNTSVDERGMVPVSYIADGEWHVADIDLYTTRASTGKVISTLRFDPIDGDDCKGQSVDFAWMAFMADDGAAFDLTPKDLPLLPPDCPDLTLYTQLNGGVYVRTDAKLDANGYVSLGKDVDFDVYYRNNFNRYTFTYSSSSYVKATITLLYTEADGNQYERREDCFLEPGQHQSFSSLLDIYVHGIYARGIKRIVLTSLKGDNPDFCLEDVSTECVRVYGAGAYYFGNERYLVGVSLDWGGGISYIEDLQDGDEKLTNLVNNHDTGRLVQQSYYGIPTSQYHYATYGGTEWNYNPVQGGDQYGYASKIVDFAFSEDGSTVYIKARPMDWSQENMPAPCYMENTYTLTDCAILISNRVVDFFGQNGSSRHQELPAFYTISYLGVFHYYNGTQPWTGDDDIVLRDQPFWGGNGSCYHNIRGGNTETWAAWTNDDGWGIGLYVPDTEIMLAGRSGYNGSKSASDPATNYVAPLRSFSFRSFSPFSYSYVIASGTVEEMRAVFAEYAK